MRSLYIHIPFCRKKCLYCDFCSMDYESRIAEDYVDILYRQIGALEGEFSSIYIGGGTPSVLGALVLSKLLKALNGLVDPETEFSVEANPESLNEDVLEVMRDNRVNRLSIGVQSLNNRKLKNLGRLHDAQAARQAVSLAKKKGFENISIDLIFGLWDEDLETWRQDLKEAVSFPLKHISAYGLTYEKDTPLFKAKEKGEIKPLDNESAGRMYEYAMDYLEKEDFKQYEVSNFSQDGFSCRHNLNYWENNEYLGLGPSAVSYIGGLRKENIRGLREYVLRVDSGKDYVLSSERLAPLARAKETAALKIRTASGIDFEWFKEKTGLDFSQLEARALPKLTEAGLISYNKGGICLTKKGFLFADTVSSEFL